jgi:Protein of unknown function (DUF2480)
MITNKVAQSGLITLDLSDYIPIADNLAVFDIKPFLFKGLVLKEKDYREALKNHDWGQYEGKYTGVFCSADAIIPNWAYMLPVSYLQPIARHIVYGSLESAKLVMVSDVLNQLDVEAFRNQRVIIKGCGDKNIDQTAYVYITSVLLPVVKSLMYGEPCSTVPVFKKRKPND